MKVKITKLDVFIILIFLPYLKPYNVTLWPDVNVFMMIWKFIITIIIALMFILRRARFTKTSFLIIGFCGIWSYSMYINNRTLGENIQTILSILGILLFVETYKFNRTFVGSLLRNIAAIGKLYFVLNTITVITQKPLFAEVPEVEYLCYFLGGDNYWAFILLPLCGIMMANDVFRFKKVKIGTWCFVFMGFFDLLFQFSVSGMLTYGFLIIAILVMDFPFIKKMVTLRNVLLLIIIALFLIIYFDITDYFEDIIIFFFGEEKRNLNSRIYIWPRALRAIRDKWLLGYGYLTDNQVRSSILYGAEHVHNVILQIPFSSGVLGSVCYFGWLGFVLIIDKRIKEKKYIRVLILTLVTVFLNSMFDFYISLIYTYLLIFVLYVSKEMEQNAVSISKSLPDNESFREDTRSN